MNNYTVKQATPADIDRIMELGTEFFHESNLASVTEINPNWRDTLHGAWANEEYHDKFATLAAVDETGTIVGYGHLLKNCDYTLHPIGELWQYYIHPSHRGKGASRVLNDAIDNKFEEWGCRLKYVECAAGVDEDGRNDKLFFNMWAKKGYKYLGTTLFKAHDGKEIAW